MIAQLALRNLLWRPTTSVRRPHPAPRFRRGRARRDTHTDAPCHRGMWLVLRPSSNHSRGRSLRARANAHWSWQPKHLPPTRGSGAPPLARWRAQTVPVPRFSRLGPVTKHAFTRAAAPARPATRASYSLEDARHVLLVDFCNQLDPRAQGSGPPNPRQANPPEALPKEQSKPLDPGA